MIRIAISEASFDANAASPPFESWLWGSKLTG